MVVGAGAMGSQIGMLCALAGYSTPSCTTSPADALDRAESQLRPRLDRDVEKGRRTRAQVDEAFGRLDVQHRPEAAAATADFVIEAAVEKLDVKRELFADLDKAAPPHAILATNSSSIVSSRIADATGRPDRVCNLHFFNPALVMKCVEVVALAGHLRRDGRDRAGAGPPAGQGAGGAATGRSPASSPTGSWARCATRRSSCWRTASPPSRTSTPPAAPRSATRWARSS